MPGLRKTMTQENGKTGSNGVYAHSDSIDWNAFSFNFHIYLLEGGLVFSHKGTGLKNHLASSLGQSVLAD